MSDRTVLLRFDGASAADANRWAADLRRSLLDAVPEVSVERRRDTPETQDFGATLVLVLGAPAVVVAAKALHSWLVRTNAASIRIEKSDGTLIARNLESKDAAAIADAFGRS